MIVAFFIPLFIHVVYSHQISNNLNNNNLCDMSYLEKYPPKSEIVAPSKVTVSWSNIHQEVLQEGNCVEKYLVSYTRLNQHLSLTRFKRASLKMIEEVTLPLSNTTTNYTFVIPDQCGVLEFKIIVVPQLQPKTMIYSGSSLLWMSSPYARLDLLSKVGIITTKDCGNQEPDMMVTACQEKNLLTSRNEMKESPDCIVTALEKSTETYLFNLEPCKQYGFIVWLKVGSWKELYLNQWESANQLWTISEFTNLDLDAEITTGETDVRVNVLVPDNCISGDKVWQLIYCPHHPEQHVVSGCNSIQIIPNNFQSTIIISKLVPCTQYTFRIVENLERGKQEKLVTKRTKCPGKQSVPSSGGISYSQEKKDSIKNVPRRDEITEETEKGENSPFPFLILISAGGGGLLGISVGVGVTLWCRKKKNGGIYHLQFKRKNGAISQQKYSWMQIEQS